MNGKATEADPAGAHGSALDLDEPSGWGARLALLALRGYQLVVSPYLPAACRFFPTCSHYAVQAVERHGALKGSWLAAGRVLRCRPFAASGYDPVP